MYIHSVKLTNFKSIGDYPESEVILEPTITAIVGKNESGKSNVIEGLSQIDFMSNKSTAYASEKVNRTAAEGSGIQYEIIIKASLEDVEKGIEEDTTISLKQNDYQLTGGYLVYYQKMVKDHMDNLCSIIEAQGSNPFKLRNQEFETYKLRVAALKDADALNVPRLLNALTYFYNKKHLFEAECREVFSKALGMAQTKIHDYLLCLPSFFYRRTDKHLKTTYKLEDVEKELKEISPEQKSLLPELITLIGVTYDEFISAVKSGVAPQQISNRKKISRLVEERVSTPFQEFYQTEEIYLDVDFNSNSVTFTVRSGDGAALMLAERSNGLQWYLETFIDAKAHNTQERNVVYLFDEPGIALHVNAQKELISLFHHLAEQGNQVVYTTHSPYMLETESDGIPRIRAVVKDDKGYSKIYKTVYDARIAPESQQDTLAPVVNAIGMNLNDTFGPAMNKTNIVTEGVSDYIYICLLAKALGINPNQYAIIPSVGASNCVNICSILHGWGCKFIAVFDYDKAGVESGGEFLRKNMFYELGKQYCYLKDISDSEIEAKTYKQEEGRFLIEDLVTTGEITRFCNETHTAAVLGKPLTAKLMSNAVASGEFKLSDTCKENFQDLFDRIARYTK